MGDDRGGQRVSPAFGCGCLVAVSGRYHFPNGFCTDCAGPGGRLQGGLATATGFTFLWATGWIERDTEAGRRRGGECEMERGG